MVTAIFALKIKVGKLICKATQLNVNAHIVNFLSLEWTLTMVSIHYCHSKIVTCDASTSVFETFSTVILARLAFVVPIKVGSRAATSYTASTSVLEALLTNTMRPMGTVWLDIIVLASSAITPIVLALGAGFITILALL